jgi:protein-tyrosine phosphatase
VAQDLVAEDRLRIDWLLAEGVEPPFDGGVSHGSPHRLGLTILPGKHGASTRYPGRVYRRDLARDLTDLSAQGVGRMVLLVEDAELERWGDPRIVERAAERGIEILRHPMPDGGVPASLAEMDAILAGLRTGLARSSVAVACMGGVGRTGMVAACALVADGVRPDAAIARVRSVRHPEAVETEQQRSFVHAYATHVAARGQDPRHHSEREEP